LQTRDRIAALELDNQTQQACREVLVIDVNDDRNVSTGQNKAGPSEYYLASLIIEVCSCHSDTKWCAQYS
jgi:hypothetical protein